MADFQRKKIRPWDGLDAFLPISNQLVTNKEPISNQLVTNISNQENELGTNKEPISNPIGKRVSNQISNQLVTQLVTNFEAKNEIRQLCGLQKKILFFIVEQCILDGSLISGYITNEALRLLTNTNADTIKTAVHRLTKKGLIKRVSGKRGKGGYSMFEINTDIRNYVQAEKETLAKIKPISNQLVTQLVTDYSNQLVTNKVSNKEPSDSSSSSNININKTTTTELPPEWLEIDLSELHKRNIRFTQRHISQYWQQLQNTCAIDFQDSIDGLVFDLDNGHLKVRRSALHLLISVVREGGLYTPTEQYRSPHREAVAAIVEKSKAEQEVAFKAWVERNTEGLCKQLEAVSLSLANDFKNKGKDAMDWIKQNIYTKRVNKN